MSLEKSADKLRDASEKHDSQTEAARQGHKASDTAQAEVHHEVTHPDHSKGSPQRHSGSK